MQYQVISFYKYVPLENPEQLRDQLRGYCQNNQMLGRILIGKEGINGAVSGKKQQIEEFKHFLKQNFLFRDLTFREQEYHENAYHKLIIKVRPEICAFGAEVNVAKKKGQHLAPQKLKEWYEKNEDFVIVDARNDYEFEVGRFKNAVKLPIKNFREFPEQSIKQLEAVKNKKIVLYCTGGIRCEKASAYLREQGFPEVYQIEGGIINYVNQLPNTFWEGGLFVFDDRLVSDVGNPITFCKHCETDCEQYVNCHNLDCDKLFIICAACQKSMNKTCSEECKNAPRHRKIKTKAAKVVGVVENYYPKAKVALIKTTDTINMYTKISFSGRTTENVMQEVTEMRDATGQEIPCALADQYITIPVEEKIRKNDKVMLA